MTEDGYEWKLRVNGHKYDPSQPRVAAGDPRGGQWTSGSATSLSQNQQAFLDRYIRMYGEDQNIATVEKDKTGEAVLLAADSDARGFVVDAYRDNMEKIGTMSFNLSHRKLMLWRQGVAEEEQRKGVATLMLEAAKKRWPNWEVVLDPLSPLTSMGSSFWESTR